MKIHYLILSFLVLSFSCKKKADQTIDYSKENLDVTTSIYPKAIAKIFKAHGGLDQWNTMQTLSFTMENPEGDEVTTTALKSRKSLITMPKHHLGFDGKEVWLLKKDTTTYKGNPKFYYNLMFYFHAMPFVLADNGIIYTEVEPLQFEGKDYPGIKISYEAEIGESPDDEYILYFNPETHKMEWLAYTVTYFSKEKSKDFRFIKYSNWQTIKGLLLPGTLTWFNYENNLPTTKRSAINFVDIELSEKKPDDTLFEKPNGAEIVE